MAITIDENSVALPMEFDTFEEGYEQYKTQILSKVKHAFTERDIALAFSAGGMAALHRIGEMAEAKGDFYMVKAGPDLNQVADEVNEQIKKALFENNPDTDKELLEKMQEQGIDPSELPQVKQALLTVLEKT